MGLIEKARENSPWIYILNTGSCGGCDMEIISLLSPKYDLERYGIKIASSPRHADIVLVTGTITTQLRERMLRILSQVPEPKVIISLGACPSSCGVFKDSYSVDGPLDKWIKVDVYVGGCPPSPEGILKGILDSIEILKNRKEEEYYGQDSLLY